MESETNNYKISISVKFFFSAVSPLSPKYFSLSLPEICGNLSLPGSS